MTFNLASCSRFRTNHSFVRHDSCSGVKSRNQPLCVGDDTRLDHLPRCPCPFWLKSNRSHTSQVRDLESAATRKLETRYFSGGKATGSAV